MATGKKTHYFEMPETPHKHYTFEGFEMHFANHPPKPRAQGSSPCTPAKEKS